MDANIIKTTSYEASDMHNQDDLSIDEALEQLNDLAASAGWEDYDGHPQSANVPLGADLHNTAAYILEREATEDSTDLLQDQDYQDAIFYLDAHNATHLIEN